MFTHAIVRTPGRSMIHGLSTGKLGLPDYQKALMQHAQYTRSLEECGLNVLILDADESCPDSTFLEDVALLTPSCAIITNPGAPSRKDETRGIKAILGNYYDEIEVVQEPGTVEGGDMMMVGSHFYIGLSSRTNLHGARQVLDYLEQYGMSGTLIKLDKMLHLKTGVSYLERNNLLACGEFQDREEFAQFNILSIAEDECAAANCIWVNDVVLMPKGYPKTYTMLADAGYEVKELDVSEFQKLDGGLSCLSLRF